MLFIINKSPFASKSLDSCLKIADEGDTILFIEDGVCAVNLENLDNIRKRGITLYALKVDVEARGISSSIPVTDYEGFVDLVEKDSVVSWI